VQVGVWCIGEFGDLLVAQDKPNDAKGDEESISITVSEVDTLDLFEQILRNSITSAVTRQYALTALLKLSSRFSQSSLARIRDMISQFKNSIHVELQQRSCEYLQMFQWEQIRPVVLDRMPAAEVRNTTESVPVPVVVQPLAATPQNGDLVGLWDTTESRPPPKVEATTDILEMFAPVAKPSQPIPNSNSAIVPSLLDLDLSLPVPQPPQGQQQVPPALTIPSPSLPNSGASQVVGYSKNGISIVFEFSKGPQFTTLNGVYTNSNPFPINNFTVQAAVPKYLKIQMSPASATVLQPNNSGKITQVVKIINSMQGQKPIVLRIKLDFVVNGSPASDTADVNFPLSV